MSSESCKEQAVDFYLSHGFILFPLKGKNQPLCKWRQAAYDPFFSTQHNFGVALQPTDLVIDIDPRNGGDQSADRLCRDLKLSIKSFRVSTGSGGTHIYLSKPAEIRIRKNLKEYPGIDFLSDGCYVVGAGSEHPDTGFPYQLQLLSRERDQAPQNLLDLIQKQEVVLKPKNGDNYVDDHQTRERFKTYLSTAEPAVEGQNGDEQTFKVAAVGRDYGLPADITYQLLSEHYNPKCRPPWTQEDLKKKVENAYSYAHGSVGSLSPKLVFPKEKLTLWTDEQDKFLHRSRTTGGIMLNQHNTALMFAPGFPLGGLLALDLFSHNIVFKKKAPWHTPHDRQPAVWTNSEATRCRHWLSTNWKFEPSQMLMHDGALAAAYQYQFHPVKEYFGSLKWDGHKRLYNWMHQFLGCVDDDYTRAVGVKTLVAVVNRVYEPGCKFDYITVLEGAQRTGKSTAWKILAGAQWFGDSAIDISKEWSIMKTFGKLIYEWAEMETFNKAGTQAMKSFLSSSTDTVRLPYASTVGDIPRQGIFVGTHNPERDRDLGWLRDTTGNTRYWVIETGVTGDILNDKLRAVRDQLWAEAIEHYRAGVPIYFEDKKLMDMAAFEQAKRMGKDPWHDAIEAWLKAPQNLTRLVFSGEEIFKDCIGGNLERYKRPEMGRIGNVMSQLGWTKGTHYHTRMRTTVRGFRRPSLE